MLCYMLLCKPGGYQIISRLIFPNMIICKGNEKITNVSKVLTNKLVDLERCQKQSNYDRVHVDK